MTKLDRCLPIIAGNWKMNGLSADLHQVDAIEALAARTPGVCVALAPPFTLIRDASGRAAHLAIGAQDAHLAQSGAHTGCVSPEMVADAGGSFVVLGHSERRSDQREDDALVRAKTKAVLAAGLQIILCVGETEVERDDGRADAVVAEQLAGSLPERSLDDVVVAYEPVWAIGTGRTANEEQIAAMHAQIRSVLRNRGGADVPILYGGSVKPDNARAILSLPEVGGALVGGASLKAESFAGIVEAAV